MPFEEILLEGCGVEGWIRMGGQLGGFFEDALDGGGFGVESWEGHEVVKGGLAGSDRSLDGLLERQVILQEAAAGEGASVTRTRRMNGCGAVDTEEEHLLPMFLRRELWLVPSVAGARVLG